MSTSLPGGSWRGHHGCFQGQRNLQTGEKSRVLSKQRGETGGEGS